MLSDFYKHEPTDQIWWTEHVGYDGEFLFSFDKKKIFNLFQDYPKALTPKQKEIFDRDNPFWADFFKDRTEIGAQMTNQGKD